MYLHETIKVKGCVTTEHFIKGRSLPDLERLLGFQKGRLAGGAVVAALKELPNLNQFRLLGYTQVAEHKSGNSATAGLDMEKIKKMALNSFAVTGYKRLVKVIPNIPHSNCIDNDLQYPPGEGIPQWKLTEWMRATVVAILE